MKAFLIPGAFEDLKDRDYQTVLDAYRDLGYQPEFMQIDWKYKTIDDWVEQVKSKVSKKDLQDSLLSGFSWGAMIALVVSAKYVNPRELFLFDLSPYFAEDLPSAKKSWQKWAGKKRVESFKYLRIKELVQKIKCPTIFFLGTDNRTGFENINKRVIDAHMNISGSRLIIIDGVGHNVDDPKYVAAIKKAL